MASDDPTASDTDYVPTWFDINMTNGIFTINEVRFGRGLDPVPGDDKPWLPLNMAPYDFPDRGSIPPGAERREYAGGWEEQAAQEFCA